MSASRKWMARVFVSLNVAFACLLAFGEVQDAVRAIPERAGAGGYVALAALLALSTVALADVLVNDVLPDRFVMRFGLKHRHTIYMLMSLGCLSIVFVLVKQQEPSLALLHYSLVAYGALLLAVLDVRDKTLSPKK